MQQIQTQPEQETLPIVGTEIFSWSKWDACTHCGLCLPTCPTYRELGLETDSPRGRLYLMGASFRDNNPIPINEDWEKFIYRCLDCRACETACPSGVHFGELVEEARAIYELNTERPAEHRFWRRLVFKELLPHTDRLDFIFELMWLYQRLGIRWLVQKLGILKLMGRLGEMESLLPAIPDPSLKYTIREFTPAKGEAKYRVGFISGCVMNQVFTETNLATIRVLSENGCDVITPHQQTCCGALHVHNGVRDTAIELARNNIDVFAAEDVDVIIINAAGCGATLKEYEALMEHDPVYAEKAKTFSSKMRDISEFLAEIEMKPPEGEIHRRVTYDEPCHLVHGQQIQFQPRKVLQSIPGLELIELQESEWCCGGAGIYNITQPEMSREILARKMKHIGDTDAEIIATGNPGCVLQIQVGVKEQGLPMKVMHPIDLLDCAYRKVDPLE
ncbi:MAG: heterodisulfide reductase-related iron-sulfur binding cluster [Candidatus Poribacteria bacterium]|nr:heterodisulfide reductase-related iron-sulfur binding cluster [Candidatus Poribacteria bacterium]